jgi:hypothetical protein
VLAPLPRRFSARPRALCATFAGFLVENRSRAKHALGSQAIASRWTLERSRRSRAGLSPKTRQAKSANERKSSPIAESTKLRARHALLTAAFSSSPLDLLEDADARAHVGADREPNIVRYRAELVFQRAIEACHPLPTTALFSSPQLSNLFPERLAVTSGEAALVESRPRFTRRSTAA